MTIYFMDFEFGEDTNPGTYHAPRLTPPPPADGDMWMFARGSTWNVDSYFARTPAGAERQYALIITPYLRPGDDSAPMPVVNGNLGNQHTMTFMDIDVDINSIQVNGGLGSALRITSKFFPLDAVYVVNNKIMGRKSKGLLISARDNGAFTWCQFSDNVVEFDPGIRWQDRTDGIFIGGGVSNCDIQRNQITDCGHSAINLYVGNADDIPSNNNRFIGNRAYGHNSGHCRAIGIGGRFHKVCGNTVENNIGEGMSAFDKLNGVSTIYRNCKSDYGITATANNGVQSTGGMCVGGDYPVLQLRAMHGMTLGPTVYQDMVNASSIIVFEHSDGLIPTYLFDNVELDGQVSITAPSGSPTRELTPEQANQLPEFNLV